MNDRSHNRSQTPQLLARSADNCTVTAVDRKPRVLVADDHEPTRAVFATALERAGYDTRQVAAGTDVMGAVSTYRPDVVILDHLMPGRTGAEIARELRSNNRTAKLPIVIATGDLLPEAATPNADPLTRYLSKPVELMHLAQTVGELLLAGDSVIHVVPDSPFRRAGETWRRHGSTTFEQDLEEARHANNDAFNRIYRKIAPRIESYARARGAPHPDDLVNDVLLKVFTRLEQFEGNEAQFNAWVFQAVRNTLIDQARKRAVRPVETLVDLTPQTESPDDPERTAVGNVQLASLLEHLDVLTPEQRDVVLLRVVADLSISAIAELHQKSPNAIKAMQRRAFTTLADSLEHHRALDGVGERVAR